jgi:hypothetical protein
MHWANLIASASSLPGLELAGWLEVLGGVGPAVGTVDVEAVALLPLLVPKLAVRVAPGPPHAARLMAAVAARTANPARPPVRRCPVWPSRRPRPAHLPFGHRVAFDLVPVGPFWWGLEEQLYGTDGYTKVTRTSLV